MAHIVVCSSGSSHPTGRVRLADGDNDCLILRKVVRREDVKWPRPRPAQHKTAGERLVLRIRPELFPDLKSVAPVVDSHASLENPLHSMDSEHELPAHGSAAILPELTSLPAASAKALLITGSGRALLDCQPLGDARSLFTPAQRARGVVSAPGPASPATGRPAHVEATLW